MYKIFWTFLGFARSSGFSKWKTFDEIELIEYSEESCNTSVITEFDQLTCGKFDVCEITKCSVRYSYEFVIFDAVNTTLDPAYGEVCMGNISAPECQTAQIEEELYYIFSGVFPNIVSIGVKQFEFPFAKYRMQFFTDSNLTGDIELNFNSAFSAFNRYNLITPGHSCPSLEPIGPDHFYNCAIIPVTDADTIQIPVPTLVAENTIWTDVGDVPAAYLSQFQLQNLQQIPPFSLINKTAVEGYDKSQMTYDYHGNLQKFNVKNEIIIFIPNELQNDSEIITEINGIFCADGPFPYCSCVLDDIYFDNTKNTVWYQCTIFADDTNVTNIVHVLDKQLEMFPNNIEFLQKESFENQKLEIFEISPENSEEITTSMPPTTDKTDSTPEPSGFSTPEILVISCTSVLVFLIIVTAIVFTVTGEQIVVAVLLSFSACILVGGPPNVRCFKSLIGLIGTVAYFGTAETLDWKVAGGIIGGLCGFWIIFAVAVYICRKSTEQPDRWSANFSSKVRPSGTPLRATNPYETS